MNQLGGRGLVQQGQEARPIEPRRRREDRGAWVRAVEVLPETRQRRLQGGKVRPCRLRSLGVPREHRPEARGLLASTYAPPGRIGADFRAAGRTGVDGADGPRRGRQRLRSPESGRPSPPTPCQQAMAARERRPGQRDRRAALGGDHLRLGRSPCTTGGKARGAPGRHRPQSAWGDLERPAPSPAQPAVLPAATWVRSKRCRAARTAASAVARAIEILQAHLDRERKAGGGMCIWWRGSRGRLARRGCRAFGVSKKQGQRRIVTAAITSALEGRSRSTAPAPPPRSGPVSPRRPAGALAPARAHGRCRCVPGPGWRSAPH